MRRRSAALGGPSHLDTFDPKPALERYAGQLLPMENLKTERKTGAAFPSPFKFRKYGQSGIEVSELFPHVASCIDDICVIRSMHTEGVAHGPATLFLHTGTTNFIRPSMGAWVTYGLGTENENLPGFVSISPSMGNGGPRNFSNAFLPAVYQGTAMGRSGIPATEARIRNLVNPKISPADQRKQFDLLRAIHHEQLNQSPDDDELEAVINSFELAWRMQNHAPGIMDFSRETPSTLAMYGIGEAPTDNFGRQCLMARRLCEAGVRYVQVNYGDNTNNISFYEEVQVSTANNTADNARITSFNMTSKRGANDFHGGAYYKHFNSALNARNFFDPLDQPIPPFKYHFFGGDSGGQVREGTYFYAQYWGLRIRQSITRAATVPDPVWLTGDFSSIPETLIDPETGFPFIREVYRRCGSPERASNLHLAEECHDYGPNKRRAAYKFFAGALGLHAVEEDLSKIAIEPPERWETGPMPTATPGTRSRAMASST